MKVPTFSQQNQNNTFESLISGAVSGLYDILLSAVIEW